MKQILITFAIVGMLCAAVSAQTPSSPVTIYAGGGLSMPMSPDIFKDHWKMGYHGMAGAGFALTPGFQLVGKVEYHMFPLDAEGVDGLDVQILMFGADGRFSIGLPAAPVKPFVLGGMGMAKFSVSDLKAGTFTFAFPEETDLYFNVGAGLDLKAGPAMSLFIQGRYVNVLSEGEATSFVPITVGLKFF
jgi:opacity protein-like surface antigen